MKTKTNAYMNIGFLIALILGIAACAGTNTKPSTGEYIDDRVISTKVKSALLNSPVVSGFSVEVETHKGAVQLSGFVDSKEERAEAARIAASINGVRSVENKITVK